MENGIEKEEREYTPSSQEVNLDGNGLPSEQQAHQFVRSSTLHFIMNREKNPRIPRRFHIANDEELQMVNRYAKDLQKSATFYNKELADSDVHFIFKGATGLKDMVIYFGKENFNHLTGVMLDRKSAFESIDDYESGNGNQGYIYVKNDGSTEQKLTVIGNITKLTDTSIFQIDDLSNVAQANKLGFDKALESKDGDFLLALKNFDDSLRPYSLLNITATEGYENVPKNTVLAVIRENDETQALEILSINEKYVRGLSGVEDITQLVISGIEKKAREEGEVKVIKSVNTDALKFNSSDDHKDIIKEPKLTSLMKQKYGITKSSPITFTEKDTLYTAFRKVADNIYKNGEWTKEDETSAVDTMIRNSRYLAAGVDLGISSIEVMSATEEEKAFLSTFKDTKASMNVFKTIWSDNQAERETRFVLLDGENKSGKLQNVGYSSRSDSSLKFAYGNMNRAIGYDKLQRDLMKSYFANEEALTAKGVTLKGVSDMLAMLTKGSYSGKKYEHFFERDPWASLTDEQLNEYPRDGRFEALPWRIPHAGGFHFVYPDLLERDRMKNAVIDFVEGYLNETYDIILQQQYEKDISTQTRARAWQTKKNINQETQERMDNTSLKERFNFVEIDNDVDLDLFNEFETEMSRVADTLPKAEVKPNLRLRKLGNYHALGLFVPTGNVGGSGDTIAIDFRDRNDDIGGIGIQSFIHEYGHFLDYRSNPILGKVNGFNADYTLSLQPEFQTIVSRYRENVYKLPKGSYVRAKAGYYITPTEVFARAFEIYSSNAGLDTIFIKSQAAYQNQDEYKAFDNVMREELTAYFDKQFPEYKQAIQKLTEKKSSVSHAQVQISSKEMTAKESSKMNESVTESVKRNETEKQVSGEVKSTPPTPQNFDKMREFAKSRNILDVASAIGMDLFKSGNTYKWSEHDSFTIFPSTNSYKWFSQDKRGDVISLVQNVKNISFKEAVNFLNDPNLQSFDRSLLDAPKEPFKYLLKDHQTFNYATDYLVNERKLSLETVAFFRDKGVLAEATRIHGDHSEPVVVFKSFNEKGELVGANLQGIVEDTKRYDRGRLKEIVRGSDGQYGMSVDLGNPKRLIFFESPIDLMSYYELKQSDLSDVRLVSMDGLKRANISNYFKQQYAPKSTEKPSSYLSVFNTILGDTVLGRENDLETVKERLKEDGYLVTLAIDNDEAGRKFATKLQQDHHRIPIELDLPPLDEGGLKMDWNAYLQQQKGDNIVFDDIKPTNVPELLEVMLKRIDTVKETKPKYFEKLTQRMTDGKRRAKPLVDTQKLWEGIGDYKNIAALSSIINLSKNNADPELKVDTYNVWNPQDFFAETTIHELAILTIEDREKLQKVAEIYQEGFEDKDFQALSPEGSYKGSNMNVFNQAKESLGYVQETLKSAENAGFGYSPKMQEQALLDFLKKYVGNYDDWKEYKPNPWAMGGRDAQTAIENGKAFRTWFEEHYGQEKSQDFTKTDTLIESTNFEAVSKAGNTAELVDTETFLRLMDSVYNVGVTPIRASVDNGTATDPKAVAQFLEQYDRFEGNFDLLVGYYVSEFKGINFRDSFFTDFIQDDWYEHHHNQDIREGAKNETEVQARFQSVINDKKEAYQAFMNRGQEESSMTFFIRDKYTDSYVSSGNEMTISTQSSIKRAKKFSSLLEVKDFVRNELKVKLVADDNLSNDLAQSKLYEFVIEESLGQTPDFPLGLTLVDSLFDKVNQIVSDKDQDKMTDKGFVRQLQFEFHDYNAKLLGHEHPQPFDDFKSIAATVFYKRTTGDIMPWKNFKTDSGSYDIDDAWGCFVDDLWDEQYKMSRDHGYGEYTAAYADACNDFIYGLDPKNPSTLKNVEGVEYSQAAYSFFETRFNAYIKHIESSNNKTRKESERLRNQQFKGRKGTWYDITESVTGDSTITIQGKTARVFEHEDYGDMADWVIVEDGKDVVSYEMPAGESVAYVIENPLQYLDESAPSDKIDFLLSVPEIQETLSYEGALMLVHHTENAVLYENLLEIGKDAEDKTIALSLQVHGIAVVEDFQENEHNPWSLEVLKNGESQGYLAYGEDYASEFNVTDELDDFFAMGGNIDLHQKEEVDQFVSEFINIDLRKKEESDEILAQFVAAKEKATVVSTEEDVSWTAIHYFVREQAQLDGITQGTVQVFVNADGELNYRELFEDELFNYREVPNAILVDIDEEFISPHNEKVSIKKESFDSSLVGETFSFFTEETPKAVRTPDASSTLSALSGNHYTTEKTGKQPFKAHYHLATQADIQFLNNHRDDIEKAIEFYDEKIAGKTIHFVSQTSDGGYDILPVEFGKENFGHLLGFTFFDNGKELRASELYDSLVNKHYSHQGTLVANEDAMRSKIKAIGQLENIFDSKSVMLNDLSNIKSGKNTSPRFEDAVWTENKDLLLAIKEVQPKVHKPYSLMNTAKQRFKNKWDGAGKNPLLAVLFEEQGFAGRGVGTLSLNNDLLDMGQVISIIGDLSQQIHTKIEQDNQQELKSDIMNQDKLENTLDEGHEKRFDYDYDNATAEQLSEQALKAIRNYTDDPKDFADYVEFMSKFPDLSPRNVALIKEQWRGANAVATYNQWQDMHDKLGLSSEDVQATTRTYVNKKTGNETKVVMDKLSVRSGEKSQIKLFRPIMDTIIPVMKDGKQIFHDDGKPVWKNFKSATAEEKAAVKAGTLEKRQILSRDKDGNPRFTYYKVFEISQTNMKPEAYPKAMPNRRYNFEIDATRAAYLEKGLVEYSNQISVPIEFDETNQLGNAKGAFYPSKQVILLNPNNTTSEKLATSIHELAHAVLHNPLFTDNYKSDSNMPTSQKEFEAELTSHLVAKHYGMDTSEESVGYIAKWTKGLKTMTDEQLNRSLQRVHRISGKMMETIDKYVKPKALSMDQAMQQNQTKTRNR